MSESASSSATAERIDRVVSSEAKDALERLNGSELMRAGAVNMIGLDAVRLKLGDRWPAKRARVWEHVERDLEKRLSPSDMVVRLDEVNYLIAISGASRFAAQATCMHALKDLLQFFLGESRSRDIAVSTVTSVDGGQVSSAPLDPAAIEKAAASPPPEQPLQDQQAPDWRPPLAGRTEASTFIAQDRKPAEVKLAVEPVWNLRRDLVTSFLVDRSVAPKVTDDADVLQVDTAVMAYVAGILHEHMARGEGRLTLHLPISFSSVASSRSRDAALRMLRHMNEIARETVLIEIADLDPGVPQSRLIEIVSLIKPVCLGVLARVRPTKKALAAVRGCGLRGLVLDASGIGRTAAERTHVIRAFAEAGQGIAPNLIVHGLDDPIMIEIAKAAGMTHASLRPDLRHMEEIAAA